MPRYLSEMTKIKIINQSSFNSIVDRDIDRDSDYIMTKQTGWIFEESPKLNIQGFLISFAAMANKEYSPYRFHVKP